MAMKPACRALALAIGLALAAGAAAQTTVNFATLPTGSTPALTVGALTVTAERPPGTPGLVYVLTSNGIGVVGGSSDNIIDTGERMRFAFGGRSEVVDTSIFMQFILEADGDTNFGEYTLQAFRGPVSLGTFNISRSNVGTNAISGVFSNQPLTAFTFTPNGDSFRIERITFTLQSSDRYWSNPQSSFWDDASSWDKGTSPYDRSAVFIQPTNGLRVAGPFGNTTVHALSIGATGSGIAVLEMSSGDIASLTSIGIGPRGAIELTGGQVLQAPQFLFNEGVLRGNGQVDARLINESGGRVTIGTGQRLEFTADAENTNLGAIEVGGGEARFTAVAVNKLGGTISGRDAVLRFDGGLSNAGGLNLTAGLSEVHGNVSNKGTIALGARAEAIFYDDFEQAGAFVIPNNAVATMFGSYTGLGFTGDGELVVIGTLSPGFSPAIAQFDGDLTLMPGTLTTIDVEGLVPGQFDVLEVAGRATLDGMLKVLPAGGFGFARGQSFRFLSALGGVSGQFAGLGDGALVGSFDGVELFIDYGANDVVLYTAPVPEPGTWALMAVGLLGVAGYARRTAGRAVRTRASSEV